MYTNQELLDLMINKLNEIEVRGVKNMGIILETIQMMSGLRKALIEQEKRHKEELERWERLYNDQNNNQEKEQAENV